MTIIRLILSTVILLSAGFIAVESWRYTFLNTRNERLGINRRYSYVPLISIFLSLVAYIIYPYPIKNWIGIIPVLDIGNWALLCYAAVLFREWRFNNHRQG
jgi:hypothetical protein